MNQEGPAPRRETVDSGPRSSDQRRVKTERRVAREILVLDGQPTRNQPVELRRRNLVERDLGHEDRHDVAAVRTLDEHVEEAPHGRQDRRRPDRLRGIVVLDRIAQLRPAAPLRRQVLEHPPHASELPVVPLVPGRSGPFVQRQQPVGRDRQRHPRQQFLDGHHVVQGLMKDHHVVGVTRQTKIVQIPAAVPDALEPFLGSPLPGDVQRRLGGIHGLDLAEHLQPHRCAFERPGPAAQRQGATQRTSGVNAEGGQRPDIRIP